MEQDIIVGIHSIAEALKNAKRSNLELIAAEEGMQELRKRSGITQKHLERVKVRILDPHKVQEEAARYYKKLDYQFSRIPSHAFLLASPAEVFDTNWLYQGVSSGKIKKILCLDQVTDVHNGAAIMRTAAFYGVDALVVSTKGNFGMGPNFARIASGALEYVPLVNCSGLPKLVSKLAEMGVETIGFSEHAEGDDQKMYDSNPICLVMGAEDVGISNALLRVVKKKVAFVPYGEIKSLNVSVAAAIAMERFFNFFNK